MWQLIKYFRRLFCGVKTTESSHKSSICPDIPLIYFFICQETKVGDYIKPGRDIEVLVVRVCVSSSRYIWQYGLEISFSAIYVKCKPINKQGIQLQYSSNSDVFIEVFHRQNDSQRYKQRIAMLWLPIAAAKFGNISP